MTPLRCEGTGQAICLRPDRPAHRSGLAAALYAKADTLASADKNAEALDIFRAIVRDYPGTDAAVKAEKRVPDALLARRQSPRGPRGTRAGRGHAGIAGEGVSRFAGRRRRAPGASGAPRQAGGRFLKLQPERAMAFFGKSSPRRPRRRMPRRRASCSWARCSSAPTSAAGSSSSRTKPPTSARRGNWTPRSKSAPG